MANIKPQINEREERGITRKELRYMYRRLENEISFMKKELEQSSGNPHACSYYADCLLQLYIKLDVLEEVINLTYPKNSTRYIATKLHYEFPQEWIKENEDVTDFEQHYKNIKEGKSTWR